MPDANDQSELILYQTDDGITRVHVRLVDGWVWLTQRRLADLYQGSVPPSASISTTSSRRGSCRRRQLFGNSERFEPKGIARFLGRSTTTRCRSCTTISSGTRRAWSSEKGAAIASAASSGKLEILYCLVPDTYDERMFHQLVARDRWHGVLLGKPALRLEAVDLEAPILGSKRLQKLRLDLSP